MPAAKPSRAVAEARAPKVIEAEDPSRARWRALDWFATPPFASRAGAETVLAIDEDAQKGVIWEPACGDGIMANCLGEYFPQLRASDIEPQGQQERHDFLATPPAPQCRWVVTNPPFGVAADFVRRGLDVAEMGVALLCRLAFLESVDRWALHHAHLTVLAPFSERVPMQLGPWNPDCSTATAYAWFIFTRGGRRGRWEGALIEPGTRERLSRPDDVRRFCKPASAPLLDL
jgi:hypothetical protein